VGSVKIAFFSNGREFFDSDTLPPKMYCPSAMVVRVHDGALAEEE